MARNQVFGPIRYKLDKLVEDRQAEIEAGKWTRNSFAKFATKELAEMLKPRGIKLSESHIQTAATNAGVKFPRGSTGLAAYNANRTKVTAQLRADIKTIAIQIKQWETQLDLPLTPEMQELFDRVATEVSAVHD